MIFNFALVQKFMDKNMLTNKEFCKNCGIGYSVFLKIKKGQSNIHTRNAISIAKYMGCRLKDLISF